MANSAAVIGLPHRTLGEEPAAVVHLAPGTSASEAELQAWVRERLARLQVEIDAARMLVAPILDERVRPDVPSVNGLFEEVGTFVRAGLARARALQFTTRGAPPRDDVLGEAIVKAMKAPSRPAGLPEGVLEGLPEGPGVYFFYGENDLPIYIGKSVDIRSRVLAHLRAEDEAEMIAQSRRVDFIETAGEIGALLLEARLIKQLHPLFNVRLRRLRRLCSIRLVAQADAITPEIVSGADAAVGQAQDLYGLFSSQRVTPFFTLLVLIDLKMKKNSWKVTLVLHRIF